jgi:hypothetical protein
MTARCQSRGSDVAKLRYLDTYPTNGRQDDLWRSGFQDTDDTDAYLRVAQHIGESVSLHLPPASIEARTSSVRFFVQGTSGSSATRLEVPEGSNDSFEDTYVYVPDGFVELDLGSQIRIAGAVVLAGLTRLSELRDWDVDAVKQAFAEAQDSDFRAAIEGPWKSNRTRKRKARITAVVETTGYSTVSLHVSEAGAVKTIGRTSGDASLLDLKRATKKLQWQDDIHVQFPSTQAVYVRNHFEWITVTVDTVTGRWTESHDQPELRVTTGLRSLESEPVVEIVPRRIKIL